MTTFGVTGFDHIVLCVRDVAATRDFYERVLGMAVREERPGKYSLQFGANKISLQDAANSPSIARDTVPGSGILQTDLVFAELQRIFAGPFLAHGHTEHMFIEGAGRNDVADTKHDMVQPGGGKRVAHVHTNAPISAKMPAPLSAGHAIWRPFV